MQYTSIQDIIFPMIHGAAIYGNMDPINISPVMLALIYQHHGSVMAVILSPLVGHPQTLRALGVLRHRDVAKCHRAGLQLGCTGSTGEGLPGRVEDLEDMMCGSKDREDWDLE